jgi:hypothetical protein
MWPKRDPAMSVDEMASKEISTEARKVIVQHVDCAREWEVPYRYSSWKPVSTGNGLRSKVYYTLEAREKFATEKGDTARSVRVTRRRLSMVPTRPKNPFFEGVECVAQERADPQFQCPKGFKTYTRRRFTTSPWRVVA